MILASKKKTPIINPWPFEQRLLIYSNNHALDFYEIRSNELDRADFTDATAQDNQDIIS